MDLEFLKNWKFLYGSYWIRLDEIFKIRDKDIRNPDQLKINGKSAELKELERILTIFFRNLSPDHEFIYKFAGTCKNRISKCGGFRCAEYGCYLCNPHHDSYSSAKCTIVNLFSQENKYLGIQYHGKSNYNNFIDFDLRIEFQEIDFPIPAWYLELYKTGLINFNLIEKLEELKKLFQKLDSDLTIKESKLKMEREEFESEKINFRVQIEPYTNLLEREQEVKNRESEIKKTKKELLIYSRKLKLEKLEIEREKEKLKKLTLDDFENLISSEEEPENNNNFQILETI